MKRKTEFLPVDRYYFDNKLKRYAQIDTDSDAYYYGQWCNPFDRVIISYCEGDLTTTTCDSDQEFINEIKFMAAFHLGNFKIDCIGNGANKQKFVELGIGGLLH